MYVAMGGNAPGAWQSRLRSKEQAHGGPLRNGEDGCIRWKSVFDTWGL